MNRFQSRTSLLIAVAALCSFSGCLALSFGTKTVNVEADDLEEKINQLEQRVQALEQGSSSHQNPSIPVWSEN